MVESDQDRQPVLETLCISWTGRKVSDCCPTVKPRRPRIAEWNDRWGACLLHGWRRRGGTGRGHRCVPSASLAYRVTSEPKRRKIEWSRITCSRENDGARTLARENRFL